MSTLKRLLNVGKGKVAVARKAPDPWVEAAEPARRSDWVGSARHAVADAAEAVADAVRPVDARGAAPEPVGGAVEPVTRPPRAPAEPAPTEAPANVATGPRKRTL